MGQIGKILGITSALMAGLDAVSYPSIGDANKGAKGYAGNKWSGGKNIPANEVALQPKKVGRNEPCTCGSGKKSKKCCNK